MPLSKIQFGNTGRRNLIINGAMQIAQRGTSATGIGITPAYNTVDRWRFGDANNPTGRFTQTQSTDAPEGFGFSHKFEVTTIDGGPEDNEMQFTDQFIEAQNLQHLKYGTSNAESVTLSFYVKSSVASTMGVRFAHEDGGGSYGASYTINSVNTWERKSITVPGNTATAINNDSERGMSIRFGLNVGANNKGSNSTAWGNGNIFGTHTNTFVGTSGATWQITGVQLEVGSSATDFEHRSFAEELTACQRYFQTFIAQLRYYPEVFRGTNNNVADTNTKLLPVAMRATSTGTATSGTIRYFSALNSTSNSQETDDITVNCVDDGRGYKIRISNATTVSNNEMFIAANYSAGVTAVLDAEL